jgi:hypothetical protein
MSIIRKIFGPSKDEIWSQLAYEYEGRFTDGGLFGKDVVNAVSGDWEIMLDHFTRKTGKHRKTYTRIRAPFTNADGLYFKLYREGFFTGIAKYFGMKDIQTGNDDFDNAYVLKGNDEFNLTWIFSSPIVLRSLNPVGEIMLEIKDNDGLFQNNLYSDGIDELYFVRRGIMKDLEELRAVFNLFAIVLEKITELDSGYA